MKMYCGECKAKSEDGILEHLETCTAYQMRTISGIDYIRPPHTVIKFDSKKERDKFYKNINGGSFAIEPKKIGRKK